jgi:Tfp pilus assembly protein PilN
MNLTVSTSRTKTKGSSSGSVSGAGALPQVNLLPPEVRAARGLVHTKRWLAMSVGVVLVVIGLVYAFAVMARSSAEQELATEIDTTTRLQAEATKYAEVPRVLADLGRTKSARTLGTSTEVLWKGYLDAITAVLPPNVSIDTFAVTQSTPWESATAPEDPLGTPGIGTITFSGRASTLPDNAAWLDALDSIPNFSHPTFSAATITALDGPAYYTVSSTVEVDLTAVANRFPANQEG